MVEKYVSTKDKYSLAQLLGGKLAEYEYDVFHKGNRKSITTRK